MLHRRHKWLPFKLPSAGLLHRQRVQPIKHKRLQKHVGEHRVHINLNNIYNNLLNLNNINNYSYFGIICSFY
jgi:hypothetical protein